MMEKTGEENHAGDCSVASFTSGGRNGGKESGNQGSQMNVCVECGKQLGFLEGYSHPTLGKKSLVCSPCFDKVQQSVT